MTIVSTSQAPSQLGPTTASPGPLIATGASANPAVERAALATPIAPAAGANTVASLMAPGSAYWDANHPQHETVKAQVRQAFEQASAKPSPSPFASPSPGAPPAPAAVAPNAQAQTFAPTDYDPTEVLRTYGNGTVDQKAASEFADFARKQGLTPAQYKAMVAFSAKEAERLADAGAALSERRATEGLAKLWNIQPNQVVTDHRTVAALNLARTYGGEDVLTAPGFNDPQVVNLLALIATSRR